MSNSPTPDEPARYGPAQHERDRIGDERAFYLGGARDEGAASIEYGQFPHSAPEPTTGSQVDDELDEEPVAIST